MAGWMWKSISGEMEVRMAYKRKVDDVLILYTEYGCNKHQTNGCTSSRKFMHLCD